MPDYWCSHCGGRSSMMGHRKHSHRLLKIIARLIEEGYPREKAVEAVGRWQIGELQLPRRIKE